MGEGFLIMSVTDIYIKKLHKLENDLERIARKVVKDNIDFILFLLQQKQLNLGKNSENQIVGRYKAMTVQWSKDPQNRPRKPKVRNAPFNFDWSGNWLESMSIKMEKDGFSIFSRDGKDAMLEAQYGKGGKLKKLSEKHNTELNEEVIMPKLIDHILNNFTKV